MVTEISKYMDIRVMTSTYNTNLDDDTMVLNFSHVHVLVATPGRVHQLVDQRIADLSKCKTIVMDEATELISPEYQEDVQYVMNKCQPMRQVCLFSSMFSGTLLSYLRNPFLVKSTVPAGTCQATQKNLSDDGLKSDSLCPICARRNILCVLASHPKEKGMFLIIILQY